MITVAESKDETLCEELLAFFIENENKECFAACLFTCYDLVKPDVAMELSWRHGYLDFAMPYLIQVVKEYVHKVDHLVESNTNREKKEAEEEAAAESVPMIPPGGPLMIQAPPPGYHYGGGF